MLAGKNKNKTSKLGRGARWVSPVFGVARRSPPAAQQQFPLPFPCSLAVAHSPLTQKLFPFLSLALWETGEKNSFVNAEIPRLGVTQLALFVGPRYTRKRDPPARRQTETISPHSFVHSPTTVTRVPGRQYSILLTRGTPSNPGLGGRLLHHPKCLSTFR